jgi:hypothetical protein
MKHVLKLFALLLLLLVAQQSAVVHELSHVGGWRGASVEVDNPTTSDASCALCPVFAQVVTAAFSHSFHIPVLGRAPPELNSEPPYAAISAAIPQPRSRGPPLAS